LGKPSRQRLQHWCTTLLTCRTPENIVLFSMLRSYSKSYDEQTQAGDALDIRNLIFLFENGAVFLGV